jgi:predicted GNAT family N-acyltransferase
MALLTGHWNHLQALAAPLRTEVFVREQGVPPELEWDMDDLSAVHAVWIDDREQVLATGRLLVHAPGVGRIGRMAVRADHRGQGWGRHVLLGLMAVARARGDRRVVLHAQISAQGFYARQGFIAQGEVFEEAGIAHIEMGCELD